MITSSPQKLHQLQRDEAKGKRYGIRAFPQSSRSPGFRTTLAGSIEVNDVAVALPWRVCYSAQSGLGNCRNLL